MLLSLVVPSPSWVTQMQSKYGVQTSTVANVWASNASSNSNAFNTMGYYWHWPQDADSNRGLGGGIQWAWDDSLCKETNGGYKFFSDNFEDQFKEDFFFASFVTCSDIKASLHRAFKVWEDLNQHIKFVDVTEECRRLYGRVQSNCSLLEVFITSRSSKGLLDNVGQPYPNGGAPFPYRDPADGSSLADVVTGYSGGSRRRLDGGLLPETSSDIVAEVVAASATQYGRYATDLRTTNGHVQRGANGADLAVIETYGGVISFNLEQCWYLDSHFCAPLHDLKNKMGTRNADVMLQGIAWGSFGLAAMAVGVFIFRVMRHQHGVSTADGRGGFESRCFHSMEEMSKYGVLPRMIVLTMLVVPFSLQHNIFTPCWRCYDFEAAAVHEIGHILGLNHPDKIGTVDGYPVGNNSHHMYLASHDGMAPFTKPGLPSDVCSNPWAHVRTGVWPGAEDIDSKTGVRSSVMLAFTAHNPNSCLQPDDIEAISLLYPVCSGRVMSRDTTDRWRCNKSDQFIGWVRVLVYIFVPIVVVMTLFMLTLSCLKHHEKKKHAALENQVTIAKREASRSSQRANAAEDALEVQVATETERIEMRAQQLAAKKIQAIAKGRSARKHTSTSNTKLAVQIW